jgi:hypothetical protein
MCADVVVALLHGRTIFPHFRIGIVIRNPCRDLSFEHKCPHAETTSEAATAITPPQAGWTEEERAHHDTESDFWKRSFWVSVASAFTATVAMVAAIAAAIYSGMSLTISRQTIIAGERPWLAVMQPIPATHGDHALKSLDFTERGAEFGLQYQQKNYGLAANPPPSGSWLI